MDKLKDIFSDRDIFFVTPDVKRALGFELFLPCYHIVCTYKDPLIPVLRQRGVSILCLEEKGHDSGNLSRLSNTANILEEPEVREYIYAHTAAVPDIMYFKPSLKLDHVLMKSGYRSIGNSSVLNGNFEDKIRFHRLLSEYLPHNTIQSVTDTLGNLNFKNTAKEFGLPFVVQFGKGWAGKTTFFIRDETGFNILKNRYPVTRGKVSKYVAGMTVLNNCTVYKDAVFVSDPAVQISNIPELNMHPGVTCGRQWPVSGLTPSQIKEIRTVSERVGNIMQRAGFKGFFGLDFIVEKGSGKIFISENNARFTASSAYFTYMEAAAGSVPLAAFHTAAFTGKHIPAEWYRYPKIESSQVIFRKSGKQPKGFQTDFGVFRSSESDGVMLVKQVYDPSALEKNEFIYCRKISGSRLADDSETARIECRKKVLVDGGGKLSKWIRDLLDD